MCELFNAVRNFVLHDFAQLYTDEHSEHILDSLCILDIDPLLNKYDLQILLSLFRLPFHYVGRFI